MYQGYFPGAPTPYLPQIPYYPVTPVDVAISHQMLPANLLSPYARPQGYFVQTPVRPPTYSSGQSSGAYLTQPPASPSLDALHVSRTVILRNLNSELSLNELLSQVDFGPIEYCKMFETPAPAHLGVATVKTCYILFVSSQVLVQFHAKYARNAHNLHMLRARLRDSRHLRVMLNEPLPHSSLSRQDYIKLKTLNYITDFGATRALRVGFTLADKTLVDGAEADFVAQCAKYGVVEDLQVEVDGERESDQREGRERERDTNDDTSGKREDNAESRDGADAQQEIEATESAGPLIHADGAVPEPNTPAADLPDLDLFTLAVSGLPAPVLGPNDSIGEGAASSTSAQQTLSAPDSVSAPDASKSSPAEDSPNSNSTVAQTPVAVAFIVHFTSIDAAIKIYELHLRRIQKDRRALLDLPQGLLPCVCTDVAFHKDRCDRTDVGRMLHAGAFSKIASPSSSSADSSPARHPLPFDPLLDSYNLTSSMESDKLDRRRDSSRLRRTVDRERPLERILDRDKYEKYDKYDKYDSSYYGDAHSVLSLNASEMTDFPHRRRMPPPSMGSDPYLVTHTSLGSVMSQPSVAMMPTAFPVNPDPFNVGNRTLYLGNLHPNTTPEEIANNVRAGGLVESINFHRAKRVCFITFVDPAVALKFFLNHQVLHQLIIHGNNVNVNWGKNHLGPLSREIALAVTAGASRNVYIGIRNNTGADSEAVPNVTLPDEETLREDFSQFGEMEQINFYHNRDCGFMNFMNIAAAIKVVELFETHDPALISSAVQDNGEFYEKYRHFKISFGKDRCGNPPKFSFKKKSSSYDFLADRELVDMPKSPTRGMLSKDMSSISSVPINNEAAMVFGITTDTPDGSKQVLESPALDSPASPGEYLAESTALESVSDEAFPPAHTHSLSHNGTAHDTSVEKSKTSVDISDENSHTHEDSRKNGDDDGDEDEDEDDDEDDDDDDDISIILGSDITTDSRTHKKMHGRHQRYFRHRSDLIEGGSANWMNSRNSSALSLNSSYAKHYNYHPASFSPVPVAQPVFFQQPQYVQPVRPQLYYGVQQVPVAQQPIFAAPALGSPGVGPRTSYAVSGSQVMAQYLAKSQHENYLYASSILQNEVSPEEMRDYKKNPRRSRKHV